MSKVRGVRFSSDEEALIEEFLLRNPMLDFSMLAKVAIMNFIKQPKLSLKPVGPQKKDRKNVTTTN